MMQQITPVVKNLIIINVIMFFATAISPEEFKNMMVMYNYHDKGRFYPFQIVTSMFTHLDLAHLFFNMLGLYFFGPLIESRIGSKKMLIGYLLGGIFSALVYLGFYSFYLNSGFKLLGASGALFTILVMSAVFYPKAPIQLIFPPVRMQLAVAIIIYIAIDVYMFFSGSRSGIAHLAHLGGAFMGLVLGMMWRKYR